PHHHVDWINACSLARRVDRRCDLSWRYPRECRYRTGYDHADGRRIELRDETATETGRLDRDERERAAPRERRHGDGHRGLGSFDERSALGRTLETRSVTASPKRTVA